eukprot:gene1677-2211_t
MISPTNSSMNLTQLVKSKRNGSEQNLAHIGALSQQSGGVLSPLNVPRDITSPITTRQNPPAVTTPNSANTATTSVNTTLQNIMSGVSATLKLSTVVKVKNAASRLRRKSLDHHESSTSSHVRGSALGVSASLAPITNSSNAGRSRMLRRSFNGETFARGESMVPEGLSVNHKS